MRDSRRGGLLLAALTLAALPLAPGPVAAARPQGGLRFATAVLAGAGGEPNVAVAPDGRTVLADGLGGRSPATLFRSRDGGRSFAPLRPSFRAAGGNDFDVEWVDERTVVAADLSLNDGIYVHRSTDRGSTWTSTLLDDDMYDRPWIAHAGRGVVYVATRGLNSGVPYLYVSRDGGRSFGPPIVVYGPASPGGPRVDPGALPISVVSSLAADRRTGDAYVLYATAAAGADGDGRLYVAHLAAGSTSATSWPVLPPGRNTSTANGFDWITADAAGNLYVLHHGKAGAREASLLYASRDRARTWTGPVDVGAPGGASVFGAIAGGGPGILSFVALRGTRDTSFEKQDFYVDLARIENAHTGRPRIQRAAPVPKPVHTTGICSFGVLCPPGLSDRSLLDYVWTDIGPDGRAYAAVASDGPATPQGPAPGGLGSLVFPSRPVSVIVLRQVSGPSYGRPHR